MSLRRRLTLLAGLLVACGPREIVVADLPPGLDGGFEPHRPCVEASDCGPDAFCEKETCGAPAGHCQHMPVGDCPPLHDPVCGCDRVTYWNQCLRAQHGVSAQSGGECGDPMPCGPGQPCPTPGASCAHILPFPSSCSSAPAQGTCWVLPLGCPPPQPGEGRFSSCAAPTCASQCEAIRSERPHARVMCP